MAMFTPAQKPRGLARITCIMWSRDSIDPAAGCHFRPVSDGAPSDKRPITTYLSFHLNTGDFALAHIRPFAAIRYSPDSRFQLSNVIAPPYDVLDEKQKAALCAKDPHNIVNID